MLTLVIYDVTDDELRGRVASFLKSKGLKRIQKSAFIGELPHSQIRNLEARLCLMVKDAKANIQIYPLTPASFSKRIVIGQQINYDDEGYLI